MKFHVPDMSCGHCTAAITKGVKAIDPAAEVLTDLDTRTVTVTSGQSEEQVKTAIHAAGYETSPA